MRSDGKWLVGGFVALFLALFLIAVSAAVRVSPGREVQQGTEETANPLPGANTGESALKNAGAAFGVQYYAAVMKRNSHEIYGMVDAEALSRSGYTWDEAALSGYLEKLSGAFPEKGTVTLSGMAPSSFSERAYYATYCIAARDPDAVDSHAYKADGSAWFTVTLYFDESGAVRSMLPCMEASVDTFAYTMGLQRKRRDGA